MIYEKPKRQRIHHQFCGIFTFEDGWWYYPELKKWSKDYDCKITHRSWQDCGTLKAFRRKLKRLPKGVEFILRSKYVGYDIIAINKH